MVSDVRQASIIRRPAASNKHFTIAAISLIVRIAQGEKTMEKRLLLLGVALWVLAGCATSPDNMLKEGAPFGFNSANTPYAAAICIARNAKAMGAAGQERLLGDASTEVVVRPSSGSRDTLAMAQIHRDGVLSKVSVFVGRAAGSDAKGFASKLMTGC